MQGPAVPTFILRGHSSPVHALIFFTNNAYLASGDGGGWLVIWSLASKRPVAVWKAHEGGITGIKSWSVEKLITHGRDHKLRVWKIDLEDSTLSTTLPNDGASVDQPQPWILHAMDMSALNFCTFAICEAAPAADGSLLIASPNGLDTGGMDMFELPIERRISQLPSDKAVNTGMVMSVDLTRKSDMLYLLLGYEDGQVAVHRHQGALKAGAGQWERLLLLKVHTQPVLSLCLAPAQDFFFTSAADAQLSKIAFPTAIIDPCDVKPKVTNTKHAGQQALTIRSDGKILTTAGWDGRVRLYSAKTLKELAVLKWHTDGCYSTAFADISNVSLEPLNSEEALTASALDVIKRERSVKAQKTHWLAAGGKDGKISLWDVY